MTRMDFTKSGIDWINDTEIQGYLSYRLAYDAVLTSLELHCKKECDQPLKPYVRPGGRENEYQSGRLISMPAYVGQPINALGVKLISGFPANIEKGIPRANGLICLFDVTTGVPQAIMDCRTISARRTAAVAAICVDFLAPLGKRRVGILGCGPIAIETIHSLVWKDRNISKILVYDPNKERTAALISNQFNDANAVVEIAESAEECVRASNVIVTATAGASNGYLKNDWVDDESLVIALSLDDCEPDVLLKADKLIVDDYMQSNREDKLLHRLTKAGILGRENVYAELGEVVTRKKPGREGKEKIYVNPMGLAVEDISVAQRVYQVWQENQNNTAKEQNNGTR